MSIPFVWVGTVLGVITGLVVAPSIAIVSAQLFGGCMLCVFITLLRK